LAGRNRGHLADPLGTHQVGSRIDEFRQPPESRLRSDGPDQRPDLRMGGLTVGQPVVHFEIIGKDPATFRSYYGDLLQVTIDYIAANSPVDPVVEGRIVGP
jgi:hypothetical protein